MASAGSRRIHATCSRSRRWPRSFAASSSTASGVFIYDTGKLILPESVKAVAPWIRPECFYALLSKLRHHPWVVYSKAPFAGPKKLGHQDAKSKELTGHYVNYRKQVSQSHKELLPESEFRLFGICARHPQQLLKVIAHDRVQEGVYDCRRGTDVIRLIVVRDLPKTEENALLHLFSAASEQIRYEAEHHHLQDPGTSTIVNQLFGEYRQEGLMPYTMKDFRREVALENLQQLTAQERLRGLSPNEILHLSEREIKAYLARLRKGHSRTKPKKTQRPSR